MRSRISRPSPALVVASLALFAALGGTGYAAATGSIDSREIKNSTIRGKDVKNSSLTGGDVKTSGLTGSDVKTDSLTGADINESTLNLPSSGGGGGGGGGVIVGGSNLVSFQARLNANETQTKTVGNFTISSATNGAGTCGAIQLQSGSLDSQRSIGANAAFANLGANSTATITAANTSQQFAAVSDDGSSSVSGTVGRAQQGNTCLLTGYMTGS